MGILRNLTAEEMRDTAEMVNPIYNEAQLKIHGAKGGFKLESGFIYGQLDELGAKFSLTKSCKQIQDAILAVTLLGNRAERNLARKGIRYEHDGASWIGNLELSQMSNLGSVWDTIQNNPRALFYDSSPIAKALLEHGKAPLKEEIDRLNKLSETDVRVDSVQTAIRGLIRSSGFFRMIYASYWTRDHAYGFSEEEMKGLRLSSTTQAIQKELIAVLEDHTKYAGAFLNQLEAEMRARY